ncbi:hypothetical protein TRICI_005192 [Trichomonascus ciferrii]|uniref:ASST-domain-containing protein n=1 Tax=Trichomonascus ciferrii TaxID=44093 RepID=A0A642UZR7_9ASCO|nr:hypothetical protein TRICI_005192 [Trichomonascus ciferrii]
MLLLTIFLVGTLCRAADLKSAPYESRIDLLPASLKVSTFVREKVSDDMIFIAPWSSGNIEKSQKYLGPHIFKADGELIWTGYGRFGNSVVNFMPSKGENGETRMSFFEGNVAFAGIGLGTYRAMDNRFDTTQHIGLKASYLHDFHEIKFTGPDTAVFSTYNPVPYKMSKFKESAFEDGWVFDNIITEVNTTTDEVVFQWNSLDHVSVGDTMVKSQMKSHGGSNLDPFDYMHLNSIVKDDYGNYLISCRHLWSLYYIDGKTGDLIWTLSTGNVDGDWEVDDDATFGFQHDANWVKPSSIGRSEEKNVKYISLFDNEKTGSGETAHRAYPRGMIIRLEEGKARDSKKKGKVSLVKEYRLDTDKASPSQGSIQVLENGNVFIGWGPNPVISEHLFNGSIIFKASLPHATYKAYKSKFKGYPRENMSILSAYDGDSDTTTLYISWNGASEVEQWNVYSEEEFVTCTPKSGFETVLHIRGFKKSIEIDAIGDGMILGHNKVKTYDTR